MEGKEIIENMTKGIDVIQSEHDKSFVYGLDQKGWLGIHGTPNMVNRFSLKVSDDNRMMKPLEAEANAYLICEAFNIANKTGLTPSQLHSELEKRVNSVDPDQMLNDVLNGFISGKYKRPTDSNAIAQFVTDYLTHKTK